LANRILKSIINDRTSGAAEIDSKVYVYLMNSLRIHKDKSAGEIKEAISLIKERFSSMANILNLLERLEKSPADAGFETIRENLALYRKSIEQSRRQTIETAARQVRRYKSIFTLSNSSIVSGAILEAAESGWRGEIRIAESRPRNEGSALATKFAARGIKTVLGVDALIPELVEKSGAVFLGADAVTPSYFVNKIGSGIAVEYAGKFHKPVFVAADISKLIADRNYRYAPDSNPEEEIIARRPDNLEIINSYFEKVIPRGRFYYICGESIIEPGQIKKLLKRRS
jgi:translation initiation factor 2B subunit (eIF-2B alpha/beta/delta family)